MPICVSTQEKDQIEAVKVASVGDDARHTSNKKATSSDHNKDTKISRRSRWTGAGSTAPRPHPH